MKLKLFGTSNNKTDINVEIFELKKRIRMKDNKRRELQATYKKSAKTPYRNTAGLKQPKLGILPQSGVVIFKFFKNFSNDSFTHKLRLIYYLKTIAIMIDSIHLTLVKHNLLPVYPS